MCFREIGQELNEVAEKVIEIADVDARIKLTLQQMQINLQCIKLFRKICFFKLFYEYCAIEYSDNPRAAVRIETVGHYQKSLQYAKLQVLLVTENEITLPSIAVAPYKKTTFRNVGVLIGGKSRGKMDRGTIELKEALLVTCAYWTVPSMSKWVVAMTYLKASC